MWRSIVIGGDQGPRRRRRWRAEFEAMEGRRLPSVTIQLDYSRDSNGFFADAGRRRAMQLAAETLSGLLGDSLAAVAPSGGDHWTATFLDPGDGSLRSIVDPTVPADTLIVFVGGRALRSVGELGLGGPGGYTDSGSTPWVERVAARGQAGALGAAPSDFGPWGGSIAFASDFDRWYFGDDGAGIGTDEVDFTSVALHELGHVLGLGVSGSWARLAGPSGFVGARAEAVHGGPVPLAPDLAHWAEGTLSDGRPAALDPTPEAGARVPFGRLDVAALADLGWQVVIDPGPTVFSLATNLLSAAETSGVATLTVLRAGDPSVAASVAFATADGTAIAGGDYTATSGVLEFRPGETSRTVSVPLRVDALGEGTETFRVDLSRPTGSASGLGTASATVAILDAPGRLRFSGASARVGEGSGPAAIAVERVGGLGGALDFAIDAIGDTATLGEDYLLPAEVPAFADGQAVATLSLPILDDGLDEPDEFFRLSIRGLGNSQVDTDSTLAVTIADDDPPIGFSAPTWSVDEDAGAVVLTVRRNGPTANPVEVAYETEADTARAGAAIEARSGTIAFASGQAEATLRVPIVANPLATGDIRFRVALRPSLGSEAADPATVTIRDLTSVVTVAGPGAVTDAREGSAAFLVSRSGPLDRPALIRYATADGTARAGVDYAEASGLLAFAPGEGVKSVAVPIAADGAAGASFSLGIVVDSGNAVVDGPGSAVATIGRPGSPSGGVRFAASAFAVDEAAGAVAVVIERTGEVDGAASVGVTILDGGAVAGRNYLPAAGLVSFGPGERSHTILIPILDDGRTTGDLGLTLALSNPTGGLAIEGSSRLAILIRDRAVTAPAAPAKPSVSSVRLVRRRGRRASLVISTSGDIDPASAALPASYRLVTAGRDHRFGTRDDRKVRIRSATFDRESGTITLAVSGPAISRANPARLEVTGLRGPYGAAAVASIAILTRPGPAILIP